MKLFVKTILRNLDGDEIVSEPEFICEKCGHAEGGAKLTAGVALERALVATYRQEEVTGQEKFERFLLAQKLRGGDEVQLTAEEIVRLKTVTGKMYNPLVMGLLWTLLEGDAKD